MVKTNGAAYTRVLPEAGFYYEGMYTLFYITFNTIFKHLSRTIIFTLFVTQGAQMRLRTFTATSAYRIGNRRYSLQGTCSLVSYLCLPELY